MVVEFSDHEFITSQFGIVVVVLSKRERGEREERRRGERREGRERRGERREGRKSVMYKFEGVSNLILKTSCKM